MKTAAIIGTGHVGTALGLLLSRHGYDIVSIHNRTEASSQKARTLLGTGTIASSLKDIPEVNLLLITTGDTALATIAQKIALETPLKKNAVAFHCSGSLPSSVLAPLKEKGVSTASLHPVKSFTDPASDAENFPGTWCGSEGDADALAVIEPLFRGMGAQIFRIDAAKKTLYHTGTVVACNYLAPLIESALQCHEEAGIARETSLRMLEPILQATLANIVKLGPAKALTGPIARGDAGIVQTQLNALEAFQPDYAALYGLMGSLTLPLARDKGMADKEGLAALQTLLDRWKAR